MQAIRILLGIVLLLFGRKLYWVFVAIAGFLVGMQLADVLLVGQGQVVRILAAVAAGLIGALLGVIAQRLAFAICGLYAGGYAALRIAEMAGSTENHLLWFILGGVIGAIIAAVIMDWAIIVLSSLMGAGAIVGELTLHPQYAFALFVALVVFGIILQSQSLEPGPPLPEEEP
ncbi:TM7S3/TM198-like domain-containing protein [Lignipirellula cremea]|uniref:TM7S3/TM198-like domain-containing protein n=1 Tax=Lignipirellula cremea TaxID=2528010 RepID=A0A518E176_9BACT|nr:DUF4203 domain-containing protein [Lignipirellula cremea]QDU97823.1 hypothetical protein Pla8534_56800 [Lignipirellula cremea]